MGWRAVMRSWAAAERQAARERERTQKRQRRLAEKRRRSNAKVEDDYVRAMADLEELEAKACRGPLRSLGFQFRDRDGWLSKPITSRARSSIPFDLEVRIGRESVTFDPPAVDFGDFTITPQSCGFSRLGTFIAFSATTDKAAAKLDLTNMSTPQNSRVLVGDGAERLYAPTDDDVDGTVVRDYARTGTVTFEPFDEAIHEFTVLLVPRTRRDGDEPVAMRVSGPGLHAAITRALDEPSLAEVFEDRLTEELERTRAAQSDRQKRAAMSKRARAAGSGGSGGLALVLTAAIAVVGLVFFLRMGTSSDTTAAAPSQPKSESVREPEQPRRVPPSARATPPHSAPPAQASADSTARRKMETAADLARMGDFQDALDTLREARALHLSREVEREVGRLIALYVERRTDGPAPSRETQSSTDSAAPGTTKIETVVVALKTGRTLEGRLIREDANEIVMWTGSGAIGISHEYVTSVQRGTRDHPIRVGATNRSGATLPSLSAWIDALAGSPYGRDARQIPATVVDVGALRHVPYVSHRAGSYELNVYGDPESPVCVEMGIVAHAPMTLEAKTVCREFVKQVLGVASDAEVLDALPLDAPATRERLGLTFEITLPNAPDAYGGWWISTYSIAGLESARLHQMDDLVVREEEVGRDAGEPLSWSSADVASARPSAGGGRSVYVRGYTRRDGTYVRPHTRSAPGSRGGGGRGRR